jgi:hypothetical protein
VNATGGAEGSRGVDRNQQLVAARVIEQRERIGAAVDEHGARWQPRRDPLRDSPPDAVIAAFGAADRDDQRPRRSAPGHVPSTSRSRK